MLLQIYGITGQLVKTYRRSNQPAGYCSISWDCTDQAEKKVAAGVYIYRLQAGGFAGAKKMVVVR